MLARLLCVGCLLTGCGVGFVDPHPAELARVERSWGAPLTSEPVVFGVAFDLQAASPAACASAKVSLHQAIVNAFLPPGTEGTELSFQDLTPDCQQTGGERLDVNLWLAQVAAIATQRPGASIRPVYVFADNLPGTLPQTLFSDLFSLERTTPEGTLSPELWGFLHPQLDSGGLSMAVQILWSDASDPALLSAINQNAQARLPFQSEAGSVEVPLFDPGQLGAIQAFKVCVAPASAIALSSGALGGSEQWVSADQPPTVQLQWSPAYAQPKSQLPASSVQLELETCAANCERTALDSRDGEWRRWSITRGCFLPREGAR